MNEKNFSRLDLLLSIRDINIMKQISKRIVIIFVFYLQFVSFNLQQATILHAMENFKEKKPPFQTGRP